MSGDQSLSPARDCERPGTLPTSCRRSVALSALCGPCKRRNARGIAAWLLNRAGSERDAFAVQRSQFGVTHALERRRLENVDHYRRSAEFNRLCARGWREKFAVVLP